MPESTFHYRVSKEVGLGRDTEGNDAPAYIKVEIPTIEKLDDDTFAKVHEELKEELFRQAGIPREFLEAIDQQEYDEHAEREDEGS